jgi:hypothetical protein
MHHVIFKHRVMLTDYLVFIFSLINAAFINVLMAACVLPHCHISFTCFSIYVTYFALTWMSSDISYARSCFTVSAPVEGSTS